MKYEDINFVQEEEQMGQNIEQSATFENDHL